MAVVKIVTARTVSRSHKFCTIHAHLSRKYARLAERHENEGNKEENKRELTCTKLLITSLFLRTHKPFLFFIIKHTNSIIYEACIASLGYIH